MNRNNMTMGNNALVNNVVGFHVGSVKSLIEDFINEYDSENTRVNYSNYIKKMFMLMLSKEIDSLTIEDIQNVGTSKVDDFRKDLKKLKYATNTINYHVFACKALWDYFKLKEKVLYNPFDIKKIKIKKEVHYGSLTEDEISGLFDYCLSLEDRGVTKKLYFEFLYIMTCRKTVAQELKMSDIKRKLNRKTGTHFWVIDDKYDKTGMMDKSLDDDFYNELKSNFDSYEDFDKEKGLLFNVENQTLEKTLKDYCKFAGIDKVGRKITQHSIKSAGLDRIYDVFEDINITAKAGGHKNIQTTYDNYIGKNVDYSQQPSYMLGKKYDINMLGWLSDEELLRVFKSCGNNTIIKACLKASEMGLINLDNKGSEK